MTTKYTPVNDYINKQGTIQWGTISQDTPQERAKVMPSDRVINIRRLSLEGAREALSTNQEVLVPGKVLVKPQENKTLLVTQECYKAKMTPSCLRPSSVKDSLTGKMITPDDLRSKKALFIGNNAFHIDTLLLHMLSQAPTKQLQHPVQNRPLTDEEQMQFVAELSLCYFIEDPLLLEQALCNAEPLNVLQGISDKSDLIFLINAERLFSCMKQPRVKIVAPQVWVKFETLLNAPRICNLLQRPSLKKICSDFNYRLAHQQGFKGYNILAPNPWKDYQDKKSFIFWGATTPIKTLPEITSVEDGLYDYINKVVDDNISSQTMDALYAAAFNAKQGDTLLVPSSNFQLLADDKRKCNILLERLIPIERKSFPTLISNEKEGDALLDPISMELIPLSKINAPDVISIGNYVFTLDSCLFRMLSQTAHKDGGIPHPLENRPLTLEEKVNFLTDLCQKINFAHPLALEDYCWSETTVDLLETLKKQHFGIAPFRASLQFPPFYKPDPSLTPDVLFAANASFLLNMASQDTHKKPGDLLWNLFSKRKELFADKDIGYQAQIVYDLQIDAHKDSKQ